MQYFFLLGNNYELAAIEVYTVLQSFKIRYTTLLEQAPLLLIETETGIDLQEIQNILGGTIKTGKILGTVLGDSNEKLAKLLQETLGNYHEYLHFGINVFSKNYKQAREMANNWKTWALAWKKRNKENYKRLRFVESNEDTLSSVIIQKNKLISENGCDFNLIYTEDRVFIGQSQTVQNFELYSQLDYGRPAYDAKVGMIPPKLAQTLINLSRLANENIKDLQLLDPFCGSGTILSQAIYSGFIHIQGTDLDPEAIERSMENLAYVKEILNTGKIKEKIFQADVNKLSTMFTKANINKVITETHLGPALSGKESKDELLRIKDELSKLYQSAISEIYKVLDSKGILVIVIPVFTYKQQLIKFDIQNMIYNNFKKAKQLGQHKELYTDRGSLLYKRPNQKLWREIFVFQKQ